MKDMLSYHDTYGVHQVHQRWMAPPFVTSVGSPFSGTSPHASDALTEEWCTASARLSISHADPFPRWILFREARLGGRLQELLLHGVERGFTSALPRLQVVEVVEESDRLERVQRRVVLLPDVTAQQSLHQVILGEDAPRFVLGVPHPPDGRVKPACVCSS